MDWEVSDEFFFQGRIYNGDLHKNISKDMCDSWKAQPTDIVVASFPKSGTTWMGEILHQLRRHHPLFKAELNKVRKATIPYIETTFPRIPNFIDSQDEFEAPRIIKTHLQYEMLQKKVEEEKLKVVVVMREPKDTIVSLYHFYKLGFMGFPGDFSHFLDRVKTDRIERGGVWKWTTSWWQNRHLSNLLFVTYEEMKNEPVVVIQRIATFMDVDIDKNIAEEIATATSFDTLRKNGQSVLEFMNNPGHKMDVKPEQFFRKGIVGDWANTMTKDQAAFIDEQTQRYYGPEGISFYL